MECYQLHYPRLVRALVLAGAPYPVAEDLAQEAFARMLTHWHRVRTGASPAGYAYRTGFRLLHRSRRPRRTYGAAMSDGQPSDRGQAGEGEDRQAEVPGRVAEGPEGIVTTRVAVAVALAAMPPKRRACAVMCLVVGLSTSQAASALGITDGTVRKHLADARDDLRAVAGP